ncbi:hypothetical protein WQ54_25840 [Bacillus sp. SA1-12]|uniref:FAD-dependent oxidoreductase n=1 Tax=Bacillus sp. SA1-12 TaxID=1455638 RepID=UPI00062733E9|nr:NAD(P)/FAD-dependent oxidoreductase [Bacillus sp. SA1-12]KKI89309.1 hypothetical protein WQ54_25840 [Bacillus sp. SA1-12]
MRVGIIGGGIGGLTLAQALCIHNIEVAVFDRDPFPAKTGGYRLHLSEEALKSIRKGLPRKIEQALRISGTGSESFKQFSILDHQGKTKLRFRQTDEEDLLMIGRVPLRKILAVELEDIIRWGTQFTHYEEIDSGVLIHFSNAQSEKVDILVGADGVHSAVARQLLGSETAKSAGVTGIAGKTILTNRFRSTLYKDLFKGPGFAVGPRGIGMFLTVHDPHQLADDNHFVKSLDIIEDPYIIWSVAALNETFRTDLKGFNSDQLENEALRLLKKWDQGFLDLVKSSIKEGTASFQFWFPRNLSSWEHSRITLIGDAVHPMPPTSGLGASTAIIDAVYLAEKLVQNNDSAVALQEYQNAMLRYAPQAVAEARPPLFWQRRFTNEMMRKFAMSIFLPAVNNVLKIKERLKNN